MKVRPLILTVSSLVCRLKGSFGSASVTERDISVTDANPLGVVTVDVSSTFDESLDQTESEDEGVASG